MTSSTTKTRVLRRKGGQTLLSKLKLCDTFWTRFRGLMLAAPLAEDEGLLFVFERENRMDSAIHMMFMRFSIAAVWLDGQGTVVDKVLAKPWRLMYAPAKPARYVIEAHPALLDRVMIGDRLTFDGGGEG
jgi:uncharacterized membrane protein (UPF0127 family)